MTKRPGISTHSNRHMDECVNILMDELQLAVAWSRPSILIAVHHSINDQEQAMKIMERQLAEHSLDVLHIHPQTGQANILLDISHIPAPPNTIYFLNHLGEQTQLYDGLNLHRENIVERRLRLILWLTIEELAFLSHRAPDFWAFRHRVVEFPVRRNSKRSDLPSGVLLWPVAASLLNLDEIEERISAHEKLLAANPPHAETLATHTGIISSLAHLYWLKDEHTHAINLLRQGLQLLEPSPLREMHAQLCNALAVHTYDLSQYHESVNWIQKAIEKHPTPGWLWVNYALICRSAGQRRKTHPSLKKAIKLEPGSCAGWAALGYVHMADGKYSAALSAFEKARERCPENAGLLPAIALCQLRTGDQGGFQNTIRHMNSLTDENGYLKICSQALRSGAAENYIRFNEWTQEMKLPRVLIRHDINLHFILTFEATTDPLKSPLSLAAYPET